MALVQRLARVKNSARFRRMLALGGAAGIATAAVLATPTPAAAHGVTMMPGSRTYLCYKDLLNNSSTQMPSNPACRAAVESAGTTPLYNWFAVLDSNAGGRGQGYVPDGTLCSAGNRSPYNFAPYNAARTDWPVTHLSSGANIQVRHSNWAHHPGKFEVYVTRSGWSPNRTLAWGDLEHLQTVNNPPQSGGAGSDGGHYYWNLQLPQRSGQHMMFIQWIRSDSQENFFSCSDIVFDGGNGQVTGLGAGSQSADEVSAIGAGTENTKADAVHEHGDHQAGQAGHADHAAHAAKAGTTDTTGLVASGQDSGGSAVTGALAGAGVLVLVGGAMVYSRQRGAGRQRA